MNKYRKIYLISDIHGSYEGLLAASQVCSSESPLFIVGDLFDHVFGYEDKIRDLILKLTSDNKAVLITGNHDVFLETMIHPNFSNNVLYKQITKPKNEKKMAVFKTLFDKDFYNNYIELKNDITSITDIDQFYQEVHNLCKSTKYAHQYNKLIQLIEVSKLYVEVEVNNYKILISHSGNITDPSSRDTAKAYYQLDSKYDFGVMGHLTIPMVEQMIIEEGDMISYSNFVTNNRFEGITIEGNYVYNKHSQMVLIDDGTYSNLVTIY